MIHVAIPCHTNHGLLRCALDALTRTLWQPWQPWIIPNDHPLLKGETFTRPQMGSYTNGRKLDVVLAALPTDARWLFTMHDDSAPLLGGWCEWLQARIGMGVAGGFLGPWGTGLPHPSGALYRVQWLRDTQASFTPRPGFDVGAGLTIPVSWDRFIAPKATRVPWWLHHTDAAADHTGRLVYAHLGGGFLGTTSWRIPNGLWPFLVRRHLDRQGLSR